MAQQVELLNRLYGKEMRTTSTSSGHSGPMSWKEQRETILCMDLKATISLLVDQEKIEFLVMLVTIRSICRTKTTLVTTGTKIMHLEILGTIKFMVTRSTRTKNTYLEVLAMISSIHMMVMIRSMVMKEMTS